MSENIKPEKSNNSPNRLQKIRIGLGAVALTGVGIFQLGAAADAYISSRNVDAIGSHPAIETLADDMRGKATGLALTGAAMAVTGALVGYSEYREQREQQEPDKPMPPQPE